MAYQAISSKDIQDIVKTELVEEKLQKEPKVAPDAATDAAKVDQQSSNHVRNAVIAGSVGVAVAAGTIVAAPLVVGGVLAGVGFTGAGITGGSIAASMMSSAAIANGGGVAAGSLVAVLQSVGAAGLSAGASVGAGAVTGGLTGAGTWLTRHFTQKKITGETSSGDGSDKPDQQVFSVKYSKSEEGDDVVEIDVCKKESIEEEAKPENCSASNAEENHQDAAQLPSGGQEIETESSEKKGASRKEDIMSPD